MRGRDIRLRIVKQPPSQSLAPHLGLPKGILLAVVEGIVVTHNPHFLVSNPSPWCVGWTSCLASNEWGTARTMARDFCVKLQKTDFPCPFYLLRRSKLPCCVKEPQDAPVSRSWGMEASGQQPVRHWSCQQHMTCLEALHPVRGSEPEAGQGTRRCLAHWNWDNKCGFKPLRFRVVYWWCNFLEEQERQPRQEFLNTWDGCSRKAESTEECVAERWREGGSLAKISLSNRKANAWNGPTFVGATCPSSGTGVQDSRGNGKDPEGGEVKGLSQRASCLLWST